MNRTKASCAFLLGKSQFETGTARIELGLGIVEFKARHYQTDRIRQLGDGRQARFGNSVGSLAFFPRYS